MKNRIEIRGNDLLYYDEAFPDLVFSIPMDSIVSIKQTFGPAQTKLYGLLKKVGYNPPGELSIEAPCTICIEIRYRKKEKVDVVRVPTRYFSKDLLLNLIEKTKNTAEIDASVYQLSEGKQTTVEVRGYIFSIIFALVLLLIVLLLNRLNL